MSLFQRLKEYFKGEYDTETEFTEPGEIIRFGVEQVHPCIKSLRIKYVTMTVTKRYHNPLFAPETFTRNQLEGFLEIWDGRVFCHRTITDYPISDAVEIAALSTIVESLKCLRDEIGEVNIVGA